MDKHSIWQGAQQSRRLPVKEIQRTRDTLRRKKKSVEMAALEEKEAGPYFAASLPDHPTTRPVPDQQTASQTTASNQTADRAEVKKAINTSHWHLRRSVTRFEQVRKQTIAQQTLYRELQDKVGKYATKNVKRREATYQSRIQKLRRQVEGGQATGSCNGQKGDCESQIAHRRSRHKIACANPESSKRKNDEELCEAKIGQG